MKQFKKSLSLFLYFITLFFLISCHDYNNRLEIFELPEGLYGGDIYRAYDWYKHGEDSTYYSSLRMGYTYENDVMSVANVNILLHFGILEDRISHDLELAYKKGKFDRNIKDYILKIYFQPISYHNSEVEKNIIIIREYAIHANDEQCWNKYKAINIIMEDRYWAHAKMCKTEYSESCIFNFNITDALFKYYLDNNLSYSLINGICITLELTQVGKTDGLINFIKIIFNYHEDNVEIVSFKEDRIED